MTRIIEDTKLDYSDVLLVPSNGEVESRADVSLATNDFGVIGVPIIAANMDGVGTFDMARELAKYKIFTALVKHYPVDELVKFFTDSANADIIPFTIYSLGANENDYAKFCEVLEGIQIKSDSLEAQTEPRLVCIDVANGYTSSFLSFIEAFRNEHPITTIIAGNVCTPARTMELIRAGADFVKIGIGPGSVCSTRTVTGVGYPQFSAVLECAIAADQSGGHVVADGGCCNPGDVAKAFAAGADAVMLGGMLAGHVEGGMIQDEYIQPYPAPLPPGYDRKVAKFYGMASRTAQDKHNGGLADYRSSEGREVIVPFRGNVSYTARHILGGLRSACTYIGAQDLRELQYKARFVKVNHQYNKVFE